ncbi:alpha/beta hydrolase [Psychromicrobium xiongbiense]|uniref:alpha/beta hydrolase n=1 Tax=Psychromicrobium xiongbiense TaxID=3051184 RepID=UPI0025548C44|nr:alpha/beta hydrolase [Psychromicrobium sp. YIM S02556]
MTRRSTDHTTQPRTVAHRRDQGWRGIGLALLLTLGLVLTACTPIFPPTGGGIGASQDPSVSSNAPSELKQYYTQKLDWTSCETGMFCTEVTVPMDYSKPSGDTIKLAMVRLPATGTRQGAILTNPGGPGSSGYDLVVDSGKSLFSATLRSSYDLVGFDPRGVQRSAPVTCLTDAERDQERQVDYDPDTASGYQAIAAQNKADAQKCQQKTGPVLGLIDTVSAARDLDILRAVLNESKLNYLGFSYGTKLGATYADLFPTLVGKFVLDGALDPTLTIEQLGLGQAKAFEVEIMEWVKSCLKSSNCPVSGSPDQALQQIRDLNASYTRTPQKTSDGRLLTGSGFNSGLTLAMYATSLWDNLKSALKQAFAGSPDGMMQLADYAADRDPSTGKYTTNSAFAFTAINCLDYQMPKDESAMQAESKTLEAASPTFGKYLGYSGLSCLDWPYHSTVTPKPVSAQGSGPIIVLGTTRDPATPYEWAVALRKQLASGVLVTRDGDGHTAYGRGNTCVNRAVDDYFVKGTTPQDGLKC